MGLVPKIDIMIEHEIQKQCVNWFAWQHPSLSRLLFAVPNGGQRNKIVAAKLKAEGVKAGVSDLLLLYPSSGCHGLCIEMKTPKGKQTKEQAQFETAVKEAGYSYVVCRSLDQFINSITNYINASTKDNG